MTARCERAAEMARMRDRAAEAKQRRREKAEAAREEARAKAAAQRKRAVAWPSVRARLVVATVRRSKDWAGAKQRAAARRAAAATTAAAPAPARTACGESSGRVGGACRQRKEATESNDGDAGPDDPHASGDSGERAIRGKRATTSEGRGDGFYSEVARRAKRQKTESDAKGAGPTHVWQTVHIAPAKRSLMRKLDEIAEGDG